MINENALVIYKSKPAVVKEKTDGKITISLYDGTQVKVRDKDIEMIHPGPVKSFDSIVSACKITDDFSKAVRETWELLLDDEDASHSLKDLAALIFDEYTPSSAYGTYCVLLDGLYFSGGISEMIPRSKEEVLAEEAKRIEKQRDTDERSAFLAYLKNCWKKGADNKIPAADITGMRFIQDVEALAYGKSAKSRTMKELGLGETPEDAHALLLKSGFWTSAINPHPYRFGLSLGRAIIRPDVPADEERHDLCHLAAFAIDSPWSYDPDDAVSMEFVEKSGGELTRGGYAILYVHVADPASSIFFDSPAEKEARDRGVTLYMPGNTVRMLADDALPLFALGLSEKSLALTFKMTLDRDFGIIETDIFPSIVKVKRITYEEADREMDAGTPDAAVLRDLMELARGIYGRRSAQGAVNIELPETRITVIDGIVDMEPVAQYRSNTLVKECMIIAGEGAGLWAAGKGLAFPYISQEVDIQGRIPDGLAGSWQLRRCMRPRVLSVKPGRHQGLGLDTYTQVTSPLRRYTDLLAHMQIRAFLRGGKPLGADEISARLGYCEAASAAAAQAERATDNHWTMVYLSGKKDSVWDAVALEKKGNRWAVIIPSLALETLIPLQKDVAPNDCVKLTLKSVNIAKGEAVFVQVI
ncbi:MAG: ribonuclease catalytic domain-containing protein [Treponema sp.]|nr:ribonuclease catalytic domain-containing protein [Treponema sp.]